MNEFGKDLKQVKGNGWEYLQYSRLLAYPELICCYSLRSQGFSIAGKNEQQRKIQKESFFKLAEEFDFPYDHIIMPFQNHTNQVLCLSSIEEAKAKQNEPIDGYITDQKGIGLALSFADCTALLFYDPVRKVIGNIHSGWRGTLQKIAQVAVRKMVENYQCNPKDIICCIGPCIRACHFEVGEEVKQAFEQAYAEFSELSDWIDEVPEKEGKYTIDTTKMNQALLEQEGLKKENIIDSNLCTLCHHDQFHSYRADGKESGRNLAFMALR